MRGIKDLTSGNINRQLFNLAMPIMATSFIQMAYSLTDMAWVGRLGSESVAVIGAVGILTWMSSAIALLNKVGAEVSVAQAIGARDTESARAFASHNITIALIISLIWGGLLFGFANPVMEVFSLNEKITAGAVSYLRTISTALPFIFLTAAMTGIYNASGRSNIPFYISGSGLVLNILLDPIFIFVLKLGTDGAAYATWISEALVFFIFVYRLFRHDRLLDGMQFLCRLRRKYTLRILRLGTPVALLNTLYAFVNMFLCRTAAECGGHIGLTAFTTGGQIEAITWNTAQGFATALSTFIAQNFAAGRHDRVSRALRITLSMTFVFGCLCTALFLFWGDELFAVFVPERAAYEAGGVFLRIDGYSQLFMMLEIAMQGVFYGLGRTTPPAIVSISMNYMRIPLAILFVRLGWGIEGIWWAISGTSIAKGALLYIWFCVTSRRSSK
jgi:putative MATE family efflux protein